jgi:meiotic recombination protein SPO11
MSLSRQNTRFRHGGNNNDDDINNIINNDDDDIFKEYDDHPTIVGDIGRNLGDLQHYSPSVLTSSQWEAGQQNQASDNTPDNTPRQHNDDSSTSSRDESHSQKGHDEFSTDSIIHRLETLLLTSFLDPLVDTDDPAALPMIETRDRQWSFHHLSQSRSLTGILLVACFCHRLLLSRRTATTREVYYYYVTHFFHQRECEGAIWDLTVLLDLSSRQWLGLSASPKGWFCGSITLYSIVSGEIVLNGRELDVHGASITPVTYGNPNNFVLLRTLLSNTNKKKRQSSFCHDWAGGYKEHEPRLCIESDATCILVIEKEGVYTRLSEDKIFETIPCILITGKGFPDVATRQWVHRLQQLLHIPAYGLCDCNPYGVSVLNTYRYQHGTKVEQAKQRKNPHEEIYPGKGHGRNIISPSPLELQWIGLRPSQIKNMNLPKSVFQQLSRMDKNRLDSLLAEDHPFGQQGWNPKRRRQELKAMKQFKVELEALHWMGMDTLSKFVISVLQAQEDHGDRNTVQKVDGTNNNNDTAATQFIII